MFWTTRQVREDVKRLEDESEFRSARECAGRVVEDSDVNAVDHDRTGVGSVEPCNQVEQRRLARPRLTDDRDVLAAADRQAQVVKHRALAIALGQAFDLQHAIDSTDRVSGLCMGPARSAATISPLPSPLRVRVERHRYPGVDPRRGGAPGRPRRGDALRALAHLVADHRRRGLSQVREPAVHRLVQGTRCAQQVVAADAGATGQGRDRRFRRQPRTGRGVSRRAARHSRRDRDAALHAHGEDRAHARLRTRDRADRRHLRRCPP